MLRHRVVRLLRAPVQVCLRCIADPERFLSASQYTYAVKRVGGDEYEVVFRWRKWGITRFYRVRIRVRRDDGRVVYESTGESEYPFRMEFHVGEEGGLTRVVVEAEMRAGLMADLLGRRDYASFVEELVDRGLARLAMKLAEEAGAAATRGRASCTDCLLYDSANSRCVLLGARVEDPSKPPCRGKDYVPADLLARAQGGGGA